MKQKRYAQSLRQLAAEQGGLVEFALPEFIWMKQHRHNGVAAAWRQINEKPAEGACKALDSTELQKVNRFPEGAFVDPVVRDF